MIFKRNKRFLIYRILVCHFFILVLCILNELVFTDLVVIWIVTVVLPNLILSIVKNLKVIETRENCIKLVFNKWFLKNDVKIYKYDNLTFTYKSEFEGANSRSMKFRIYIRGNEKSLISIGGVIDGWYEDEIKKIIAELKKNGVEMKIN